jgi:uncharacterized protein (TIGR02466 family)
MEYKIKSVFGPKIYKSRLEDDIVDMLKIVAEQSKEAKVFIGHTLAGNLEQQLETRFEPDQVQQFLKIIYDHVHACVVEFDKDQERIFKNGNIGNLVYNLGPGPWLNVTRAGEFNPTHRHTGELSVVVYIDIPEAIAEENKNEHSEIKHPVAGIIAFIHGDDDFWYRSIDDHQPKTGDILIFPSSLKHEVYPFKSDVERISMSFNIYDIRTIDGP